MIWDISYHLPLRYFLGAFRVSRVPNDKQLIAIRDVWALSPGQAEHGRRGVGSDLKILKR